jgi:osmotically-inducible protein OsmY
MWAQSLLVLSPAVSRWLRLTIVGRHLVSTSRELNMTSVPAARLIPTVAGLWLVALGAPACNREQPANEITATPPPAATPASGRDDAAIATNVRAKFYTDDTIRGRRIDVKADHGVVTLTGSVDSESAKQHAVNLAQNVDGVVRVDDELTVAGSSTAQNAGSEKGAASRESPPTGTTGRDSDVRAPAWITTKIQSQYFLSSNIKPWTVDVTTSNDGTVTVEGTVDSEEKKAEALRIARNTEGVKDVVDRITVRADANAGSRPVTGDVPDVGQPDPWITAKIEARYFVDDEIKGRNIDVETQNGKVTLKGAVGSEAERRQAVTIARNTDGVKDVVDQLRVEASEKPAPAAGSAADRTQRAQPAGQTSDAWTTTKIQAKYFIDSDVKGHEIDVDTQGGVVTLKGTVETAAQKTEAEQIARETEGVARVVNQLAVRPAQNQ